MKIWQLILLVAGFAVTFSLWTTSSTTRGMFISICVCGAIAPVAFQSSVQFFQILGRFVETPNSSSFFRMMMLGLVNVLCTGLIVGMIVRAGFYVAWVTF